MGENQFSSEDIIRVQAEAMLANMTAGQRAALVAAFIAEAGLGPTGSGPELAA